MKSFLVHLRSLNNFSFGEAISIVFSIIIRKILGIFPAYTLINKSIFDRLIFSGHKITKEGKLNKIELTTTVLSLPVTFYVRRKSTDIIIFNEILYHKEYQHLLRLQQKLSCDIRYIVDAGANIGSATIYMANVFPSASIVCVEPQDENFAMLQKNINANNLKNVTAFKGGLWNKDSWLEIREGFRGAEKERELSFYVEEIKTENKTTESIEGITVEGIMRKFSFPHIDILKIDIEGAERFLFDSLESTESILRGVKILAIEVHEEVMDKYLLVEYLEKLNFKHISFGEILYAYRAS